MFKALLIGCGNIGAMYDFGTDEVSTYAKAFHLDPEIDFEVFDVNLDAARRVATRYSAEYLRELDPTTYGDYDIAAICTPTSTHHHFLASMLRHGPKLILCEKPVDVDRKRLSEILRLYRRSNTKILVNFFRRFQPEIVQLKREIAGILNSEACTSIVVTYQRGFHNNASHAVDLIEFLFGSTLDLSSARITHSVCDEFQDDPTMSVACQWNGASVQFVGLSNVEFSHFDVSIFFERSAVIMRNGCNDIEISSAPAREHNFYPRLRVHSQRTGATRNYMTNVISYAKQVLKDARTPDNFAGSAGISERILTVQGH